MRPGFILLLGFLCGCGPASSWRPVASEDPPGIHGARHVDAVALAPGRICVVWQGGSRSDNLLAEAVWAKDNTPGVARVIASGVVSAPVLCVSESTLHLLLGPGKPSESYISMQHLTRPVEGGEWIAREPLELGTGEAWAGVDVVAVPGGIELAAIVKLHLPETKEYHDAYELRVERRDDNGTLIWREAVDGCKEMRALQPAPRLLVSGDTTTVVWARSSTSKEGWGHTDVLRYRWAGASASGVEPDTLLSVQNTSNDVAVIDDPRGQRVVVSTGGGLFFGGDDPSPRAGTSLALPARARNLGFADTNWLLGRGPFLTWLDTRNRDGSLLLELTGLIRPITFMDSDLQVLRKDSLWKPEPGKRIPRTIRAPGTGIQSIALADDGNDTYVVCSWFSERDKDGRNPVSPMPYVTVLPH